MQRQWIRKSYILICKVQKITFGLQHFSRSVERRMAEAGPSRNASSPLSSSPTKSRSTGGELSQDDESDLDLPSIEEDKCLTMSFAGCGFLGIYHLGAASTFQKHGRGLLREVQYYTGASAGALVASVLAIKGEDKQVMQDCIDFTYNLAKTVQKHKLGLLTPGLSLLDSLQTFLLNELPDDAHLIAKDRLYVSLTRSSNKKNVIVSEYDSKEDLIQCLLASSYVPHITGKKPVVRKGKKYIDGGLSDNLPIMTTGRTICVSPFSGRYDVCPRDSRGANLHVNINRQDFQVNIQNLVRGLHAFFPPKPRLLEAYFRRGVLDAKRFLIREDLYEPGEEDPETVLNGTLPSDIQKEEGILKSSHSTESMNNGDLSQSQDMLNQPSTSDATDSSNSRVPSVQYETYL